MTTRKTQIRVSNCFRENNCPVKKTILSKKKVTNSNSTKPLFLKGLSSENDIEGYFIEKKCAYFENLKSKI